MAKIRIVGDSSGYVEIAAPNAAGNNTLELPSGNTRLVGSDSAGNVSISGILTVSTGSTSIPSISPTGDSNTGIFFPSADTIAFGEGGAEAARFDSSGRLGIGTANPSYLLHTSGSGGTIGHQLTSNSNTIRYTNSNTTAEWTAGTSSPGLANAGNYYSITQLGTDSTWRERLVIDSSGRITAPYQPAFMVRGDGSGSIAPDSKFTFTKTPSGGAADGKVCFDRANNWSDANDRFTAPVAGVYQFIFGIYRQSATSVAFSMAPRINGAQVSINDTFIFFTSATGESGNTDDGMYGSFYMNLSANDYVELFIRTSSTTINWYGGHTFFGGHLVG
jgi:hypothetical protein